MKKKFINKIFTFCCIVVLFLITTTSFTEVASKTNYSFKFDAIQNSEIVRVGDKVRIRLKISNINAGKEGINTISFKLKFDENFFEDISITSKNNWSITYNNEKDNEEYGKTLAILLSPGVTKDQEIGEVTLKVKENLDAQSGEIKFTEVSTNNGVNLIKEEDKTIKVSLKEEGSQTTTINKEESLGTNLTNQSNVEKNVWIKYVLIAILLIVIVIACIFYKFKSKKHIN